MRRVVAISAGLVLLGSGAAFGASAAIDGGSAAPTKPKASALSPQQIADSLANTATRAHYGLPSGQLVSATVCVSTDCVTKHFSAAPKCDAASSTCIGTAMVARKYANNLTITVEVL